MGIIFISTKDPTCDVDKYIRGTKLSVYLSVLQTFVIWVVCRHSPCGLCWYLIAPSELSKRARHIMPDVLATFITGNVFNTDTRTFLLISLPRHSQAPTERQDTSLVRQGYEIVTH